LGKKKEGKLRATRWAWREKSEKRPTGQKEPKKKLKPAISLRGGGGGGKSSLEKGLQNECPGGELLTRVEGRVGCVKEETAVFFKGGILTSSRDVREQKKVKQREHVERPEGETDVGRQQTEKKAPDGPREWEEKRKRA